jgi:hypothetical protein
MGSAMIILFVPLIVAIWFGYSAFRSGKKTLDWALGGFVQGFVVALLIGALSWFMLGVRSKMIFVVILILCIQISILIGRRWLPYILEETIVSSPNRRARTLIISTVVQLSISPFGRSSLSTLFGFRGFL